MNKVYFFRIVLIIVAGLSFVLAHEFGHFFAAQTFGLQPSFVAGNMDSGAGFLGLSLGVSHMATTTSQDFIVIIGATLLPILIIILLLGATAITGMEEFRILAEIYFILVVINLVPIPGAGQLDANKVWSYVVGISF